MCVGQLWRTVRYVSIPVDKVRASWSKHSEPVCSVSIPVDKVRAGTSPRSDGSVYLFQSPWIRFALSLLDEEALERTPELVSIPVDKVRAESPR